MKKNFLTFSILFIFFLMLAKMDITKTYALIGLNLWLFSVLPTLLPFTIISSILLHIGAFSKPLGIIKKFTKTNFNEYIPFIIICGLFCGCPIGAKLSADTYRQKKISCKTATFLLCSLSSLSPAFIINFALPTSLSINLKITLYIIIILSNIIAAYTIVHILHIQDDSLDTEYPAANNTTNIHKIATSLTDIFENCILSSFEIQGKIGGYIIIFSCISGLFIQTLHLNPYVSLIFNSILEISSGLGTYNSISLSHQYISLIAALISFGGVCTICQMFACMNDVDIPKKCLIYSKVLSGGLTYILTYIFLN
jgi:hypothetical protein